VGKRKRREELEIVIFFPLRSSAVSAVKKFLDEKNLPFAPS
jgi:hypothetical protein